ncbi:MAG: ATP-binding cassette domain-containing protein [Candidatus Peribacteraceae bacterium]|nr:ATP-binding cassette domain-containing protein [Candidatus Peribacteraceae bacterium]MDD5741982.1 ATP-binding cassette domain-containing protein [Candidatus Peribacteraceae bacterium]
MSDAIVVKDLKRTFRHYEKKPGLLPTLKSVLWREWNDVNAVDGISFQIPQGSFVGFLGPNGAGKTTTLKMLSGILSPTSGTCTVLGFTPSERKRAFKKQIGFVMGQKSQLIWDLPPTDTFVLHRDLYEIPRAQWNESLDTLSKLLRVEHILSTPVRQLSLGERMKCELIASLLHKPKVLFLDEPTIGLDVISQVHLWEFLGTYQAKEKMTVLLTSHYIHDIANLCENVIILNKGRKVFDGAFESLVNRLEPERSGIIRFQKDRLKKDQTAQIAEMVKNRHLEQIDLHTYRIAVPRQELSAATQWILKSFPIEELRMEEVDLTEVIEKAFAMESRA